MIRPVGPLVLFGLVWCSLVLFGPKIYFCTKRHALPRAAYDGGEQTDSLPWFYAVRRRIGFEVILH